MPTNRIYQFGKNKEFNLDERALRHIVEGHFVVRPPRDNQGNTSAVEIISGGLHTWSGWEAFVAKHPNIVHLLNFDPAVHQDWYFARELQNGVITLKIPRVLFSKDAAGITMMPDLHYASGYLWKTLFPKAYLLADILQVIEEALLNIDEKDSNIGKEQSLIIGFARTLDPFTAIRIRIQLEGNEIRSAFPTWDQPSTGNNGKPYSHEHSISFQIAQSTVYTSGNNHLTSQLFIKDGQFSLGKLIKLTPKFLLIRSRPKYDEIQDIWHEKRQSEIANHIVSSTRADLAEIQSYLHDFVISKEPFYLQSIIYKHYLKEMEESPRLLNVAAIMQNVCDCFYALLCADNQNGTSWFLESMQRVLAMGVIHAGGLNTLEYKRLIKLMLDCCRLHHDTDSFRIFIESIATSPIRSALYSEFNVNTFVKENNENGLTIVGIDGVQLAFNEYHLVEYLTLAMGENYLLYFSKEARQKFAEDCINANYSASLTRDSLVYFKGSDFDFFVGILAGLDEITSNKTAPSERDLLAIVREYSRMLVIYRQRVVMEDPIAYKANPFDYEFGSQEYFEIVKQQHKRNYILVMHEQGFQTLMQFAHKVGYTKLEIKLKLILSMLPKERVPMPKHIPDSVPSWRQNPKYKNIN